MVQVIRGENGSITVCIAFSCLCGTATMLHATLTANVDSMTQSMSVSVYIILLILLPKLHTHMLIKRYLTLTKEHIVIVST